uniref:dCTP deaminase n=1 Tax=Flavobacterium sp. TaxID=239 RepID=UPI003751FEE2
DVMLGDKLCVYDFSTVSYLDCKLDNPTKIILIPQEGLVLQPNILYLGHTIERIGSEYYVPMYDGRSSMGRLGIQSHISAGVGDIGFKEQWTLEISVMHPIKVYAQMRIGQIHFHKIEDKYNNFKNHYKGKYQQQKGPQSSKSYLDK